MRARRPVRRRAAGPPGAERHASATGATAATGSSTGRATMPERRPGCVSADPACSCSTPTATAGRPAGHRRRSPATSRCASTAAGTALVPALRRAPSFDLERPRGPPRRPRRRRRHRRDALRQQPGVLLQRPGEGWNGARAARAARRSTRSPTSTSPTRASARRHDRRRAAGHRARPRRQRRILAEPRPRRLGPRGAHDATARACPTGYDPRRVCSSATSTATAPADLVYVDDGEVTLWINQRGNALERADRRSAARRRSPTSDAVRLVDLLGTGIAGVLWSARPTVPGRDALRFLDLTGGVKPYLLDEHRQPHRRRHAVELRALDALLPRRRARPRDALADAAAVPGPGRGARRGRSTQISRRHS